MKCFLAIILFITCATLAAAEATLPFGLQFGTAVDSVDAPVLQRLKDAGFEIENEDKVVFVPAAEFAAFTESTIVKKVKSLQGKEPFHYQHRTGVLVFKRRGNDTNFDVRVSLAWRTNQIMSVSMGGSLQAFTTDVGAQLKTAEKLMVDSGHTTWLHRKKGVGLVKVTLAEAQALLLAGGAINLRAQHHRDLPDQYQIEIYTDRFKGDLRVKLSAYTGAMQKAASAEFKQWQQAVETEAAQRVTDANKDAAASSEAIKGF